MTYRTAPSIGRQRGQAITELLVVAGFFLVPFLLAIVVIGKFADVQHTTHMAARYASWERTVWYDDGGGSVFDKHNRPNSKSPSEIQNEMAVRLIADRSGSTTVIKSTDKSATAFVNGVDPLWQDHAGTGYLDSYNQVTETLAMATPNGDVGDEAISTIGDVTQKFSAFIGTVVPPVPTNTLATVNVSFAGIARNSAVYQDLWPVGTVWGDKSDANLKTWKGLDFTSTGAILSNSWAANGPDGATRMVQESVPTARNLGTLVKTGVLPTLGPWDPIAVNKLKLGKVNVDVTPSDRLK